MTRGLIFAAWSLILTYPLAFSLTRHIPRGAESVGTVPFFNLWTLQWNIDQLLQGFPRYWDAPIFAPATGTFAFSEVQPLTAWLAMPIWLHQAALGYNLVLLLFLTLNGWFACLYLRSHQLDGWISVLGGLMVQSLPFVAQEMGVLQLIAIFGMLWQLTYLKLWLHRPAWRRAAGLGLGMLVTALTCGYYLLFSLIIMPLAVIINLRREMVTPMRIGQLIAVGIGVVLLAAPIIGTQRSILTDYDFQRSTRTITNNAARLVDYTQTLDYNLLYGTRRPPQTGQRLFPGAGVLILAVVGFGWARQLRLKSYLVVVTGIALVLSLGLRLDIGGVQPYQWLRDFVPGLAQLRSPFRFAMLVQLHLALLAALGLAVLAHRRWWMSLVAVLVIVESLAVPLPLQSIPTGSGGWPIWVNQQAETPRVVLLPFAASSRVADFETTTRWMLQSRPLNGDMLNGYSGFFPRDYVTLRDTLRNFPAPESLTLLRQRGVDFVIIDHTLPDAPPPAQIPLPRVYQGTVSIYAVHP